MAIETLGLPNPASPDVNDGVQDYDLAVGFTTAVDGLALGVEWHPPLSAPGVTPVVKLWRVSDQALLASKSFAVASPGVRQEILFDEPVAIPAGEYRVSVYTIFFTLTSDWPGWPASSDNMITGTPDGWLSVGPGFPGNGVRTALYHVSPLFEPGGGEPEQGAAELLAAGTLTAAARTIARGSAALQAAGTLTAAGQLVARGAAQLTAAGTLSSSARTVQRAQVSMTAVASMAAAGRLVPQAAAQLAASGLLTVTLPGVVEEPGTLTASGRPLSSLSAGGSPAATLTASGRP